MLTDCAVRSAKRAERPRKLSDGGGLYLLIAPNGGRYWRFGYRFAGKQKTLALRVYPDVGLAKARERHCEARRLLTDDIDPSAERRNASKTFEELAQFLQGRRKASAAISGTPPALASISIEVAELQATIAAWIGRIGQSMPEGARSAPRRARSRLPASGR